MTHLRLTTIYWFQVRESLQEQIQKIRELTGGDRKKLEELTTSVDARGKVIPGVRDPNVMTMEQAERALERGAK